LDAFSDVSKPINLRWRPHPVLPAEVSVFLKGCHWEIYHNTLLPVATMTAARGVLTEGAPDISVWTESNRVSFKRGQKQILKTSEVFRDLRGLIH